MDPRKKFSIAASKKQLTEAFQKTEALETRIQSTAETLFQVVDDPWCREILRSIHSSKD